MEQPNTISRGKILERWLLETREIMKGISYEFFLLHGTLLGYYRDKQLISWDNDLDLGCLLDPSEKILRESILSAFDRKGYKGWITDTWEFSGACNIVFTRKNPEGEEKHLSIAFKFIKQISDRAIEASSLVSYPWEAIKPLEQVEFLKEKFHIPNKPEILFNAWYGKDCWKTPSRGRWIMKPREKAKYPEPIELYPDQNRGYRAQGVVEALLKCDKEGNLIKPYVKTGETPRGK